VSGLKRRTDLRKFDFDKRAVGYWMVADEEIPERLVRIFVTHEALSSIDPGQAGDFHGALATFDANRDRIDAAASSKYAEGRFGDGLHEGQRVIIVRYMDL
jgi:hypothetical protein